MAWGSHLLRGLRDLNLSYQNDLYEGNLGVSTKDMFLAVFEGCPELKGLFLGHVGPRLLKSNTSTPHSALSSNVAQPHVIEPPR